MYIEITPDAVSDVYATLGIIQGSLSTPFLGEIRFARRGNAKYKFVKNLKATALAVGDVVFFDWVNGKSTEVNKLGTGSTGIGSMAGVAMGVIPASGFGWIQIRGDNDSVLLEGTAAIAVGDRLKGVSGQSYAVKDAAYTATASYPNYLVGREAYAVASAALKKAYIACDGE